MSNEVSDFLRSVEQLNHRRDEEEEARSRELEEKLLQQRKERQARREERARSISPQKSSPANTPPPSARRKDSTSQGTEEPSPIPALSAALQTQTSTVISPPAEAMDLSSVRSTSPTRETVFDLESKRISLASSSSSAVTTKSPALSWQRRPPSQGPDRPRSRPLSIVAAENAAARLNTTSAEATSPDQTASRDQISQALASKDPAWFRQTADRGANSAAYRKNQVEDNDIVDVLSARTQLPGMSHPTSSEVEDEESEPPRERPVSQAGLGTPASPLPLTDAQKLGPPADIQTGMEESASGPASPTRPASPTKGTGGFVQSAMMKRTDSVKRWSVTTPGLQRLGNAANRHSFDGSNSPGPEPTRPVSRSRDSFPRPPSSHAKDLPPSDATLPNDHVAEVAKLEVADDRTPPTTPSRTMDPKRWSPTKGSWLDAALNKPESPKPKPVAPSNQPAWMVELNRAKAERAKNASVDLGRAGSTAKKHEVKTGGLVRPAPLGTNVKPSSFSSLPSPSLAGEGPLTPGLRSNLNKTSPALDKPVLEHPILKKPSIEKPGLEKPVLEKPGFIEHPILKRTGLAKTVPEKPLAEKAISEKPTPEEPVSGKPVSEKPRFEKPILEKPVLEKPVLEKPVFEKLGFEKPRFEKPILEKPVLEKLVFEKLGFEHPILKKPSLDKSVLETPLLEKPSPEKPDLEKPSLEKPDLEKPDLEKPGLEKLGLSTTEPGRRGSITNPALEQEKAEALPVKDFRAGLRPRGTTIGRQDLGRQENKEPENELANVFGKLRRAKTQNFVPSDELKNNILKGKTALNATGGPKPYEKKDDFKDALRKKRADFEKAKEEGRSITATAKAPQEQTVPEGLAKRAEISRSGSISQYSHSRDNSIAKSPSETYGKAFESSRFSIISNISPPSTGEESAPVKEEKADAAPIPILPPKEKSVPGRFPNKLGGNALAERFNPALAGLLARGPPGIGGAAPNPSGTTSRPGITDAAKEPGPGPKLEHMTKNRARGPRRKAPTSVLSSAEPGDSEPVAPAALASSVPETQEPVVKDVEAKSPLSSPEPVTEEPIVKDIDAESQSRLPSPVPESEEPAVKHDEAEIPLPPLVTETEEPVVDDIEAESPLPSLAPEAEEPVVKHIEAESRPSSPVPEIEEPSVEDNEVQNPVPPPVPETEEIAVEDVKAESPSPSPVPENKELVVEDVKTEVTSPSPVPEIEELVVEDNKTEVTFPVPGNEEPAVDDVKTEVTSPVLETEEPTMKDVKTEFTLPSPEIEEPAVKHVEAEVLLPSPEIEEPVVEDVEAEFPSPPPPARKLDPEPVVSPKPIVKSPTVSPVEHFRAIMTQDQPRDNSVISPVQETKKMFAEQQPVSTSTNIALVESPRPKVTTPGSPKKIHEQVAAIAAKTLPAEEKKVEEPPPSPRKLDMRRMSKFLDEASIPSPKIEPEPVRSPSPVKRIGGPRSPRKLPEAERVDLQPAVSMGNGATFLGRSVAPLKPQLPPGEPIPAPLNLRPRSKTKTLTSRDLPPLPNKDLPALPSRELPALPTRGLPALPSSPSRELPPLPNKDLPALTSRELPALPSTPAQASPVASPTRSPSKSAKDVSAMLNGFFGNKRPKRNYRVDAVEVLMNRPKGGSLVQTQKAQLFRVTEQGKKIPVPGHHERVLFEREMYICPHTFTNQARKKITEVYFWVGDEVAPSVIEDAQVFINREARSMGGTLVNICQGKETAEFIQALGGLVIIRRGSSNKYDSLAPNILCGRQYMGQVVFDEVDFAPNTLCSGFPYLITQQGRCYLWKGKGSGIDEVSCSKLVGMDLALTGELVEVEEGQEPDAFWSLFGGARKESSADHWRLKSSYDKYCGRLFCSESADQRQIVEISPFSQSDLSPAKIYVLDAFFEMYVIIGREAQSQYAAFHNALDFAQEYAILAAGMEDRPFVPVSTVVLEGIPRDLRSCFRKWRDDRSPTKMLPSSRNAPAPSGVVGGQTSGLKRARSLKVLPLGQALQALGNSE